MLVRDRTYVKRGMWGKSVHKVRSRSNYGHREIEEDRDMCLTHIYVNFKITSISKSSQQQDQGQILSHY